jgi:hypothetical protein
VEQDKQKAEQDKQKAEQTLFETRLHLIKKMLKKGDSEEDIIAFLEIDTPVFELLLAKIKESEPDIAIILSKNKNTN